MGELLRVAFVDEDLANFHADTFLALARGPFAGRVEVAGCWAVAGGAGRAWAAANGVPWNDDPSALAASVDAVMVLAPSSPHRHLELCRHVLPAGKPTWIDKTFAPDLATARAILALADRHGAPIQSASALRYTAVQRAAAEMGDVAHVAAIAPAGSFAEYAVHPLELAVSVLGPAATRVGVRGTPERTQVLVDFAGGRTATIDVQLGWDTPYAAVLSGRTARWVAVELDRLFADAFAATLDFLADGRPRIDRRETLAIHAILDACADPAARERWVALPAAAAAAV